MLLEHQRRLPGSRWDRLWGDSVLDVSLPKNTKDSIHLALWFLNAWDLERPDLGVLCIELNTIRLVLLLGLISPSCRSFPILRLRIFSVLCMPCEGDCQHKRKTQSFLRSTCISEQPLCIGKRVCLTVAHAISDVAAASRAWPYGLGQNVCRKPCEWWPRLTQPKRLWSSSTFWERKKRVSLRQLLAFFFVRMKVKLKELFSLSNFFLVCLEWKD